MSVINYRTDTEVSSVSFYPSVDFALSWEIPSEMLLSIAVASMVRKRFLTRQEIEEEYPITAWRLAHLASDKKGPRYAIVGKVAVYDRDAIETYILSLMRDPDPSGQGA